MLPLSYQTMQSILKINLKLFRLFIPLVAKSLKYIEKPCCVQVAERILDMSYDDEVCNNWWWEFWKFDDNNLEEM